MCADPAQTNLEDCDEITDSGVKAQAGGCAQTQSTNLEKCDDITDGGLKALVSQAASNLTRQHPRRGMS